jgi:hypothetical protein
VAARPPSHRTVTARLRAGTLAAGLAIALGGCAAEGGMRPTLGEPRASGLLVYQPPPGSRFDFVVYVPNADRRLEERPDRLSWVRGRMANRCTVAAVTDLYAHGGGTWPDGREKVYFAVGVTCIPRVIPPAREPAPGP